MIYVVVRYEPPVKLPAILSLTFGVPLTPTFGKVSVIVVVPPFGASVPRLIGTAVVVLLLSSTAPVSCAAAAAAVPTFVICT